MENEIMQQILSELKGLKQGQVELKGDVNSLKNDVTLLKNDVTLLKETTDSNRDILLRMEHDHGQQLKALADGYAVNYELTERHEPRITKLENKTETLSIEILALKQAR